MKKLCVLLLLLSLLLGCVGCGADHGEGNTTPIATDPPAETTPTVTEPPLDTTPAGSEPPADTTPVESTPSSVAPFPPSPPYMWFFDSYEEIRELKEMTKKDNETLLEYLDSKDIMHGTDIPYAHMKEGLTEIFDIIGNWYLPYVDPVTGYHSFTVIYYPREDNPCGKHFHILYGNEEHKQLVGFTCTVKEYGDDEAENEEPIAFTMSIGGQTVSVRQSSKDPNDYYCTAYSTNMRVIIQFPNSDAATIKNTYDGKIEFLTLNELMGY